MYMDLVVNYGQVMAEYFLIAETSAVTLTIAGVIKEVVTIVVSSFYLSMGGQILEVYNVLCESIMYKCHRTIQRDSVVVIYYYQHYICSRYSCYYLIGCRVPKVVLI